jgi:hypothetical protein
MMGNTSSNKIPVAKQFIFANESKLSIMGFVQLKKHGFKLNKFKRSK